MSDKLVLSSQELSNVYDYVRDIINFLPEKAVKELIEGYGGDIDKVFSAFVEETNRVINVWDYNKVQIPYSLEYVEQHFHHQMKVVSLNYFLATTIPSITMHWRVIEWGNLIQLYPWSSYLCQRGSGKSFLWGYGFPLWRMYTYKKPQYGQPDTVDNKNRKETLLITNTIQLGKEHLAKVIEEIQFNDEVKEILNPTGKASLGAIGIVGENSSKYHLRSKDGFMRGLHCGSVLCDDLPDESSIYSQEQREKLLDTFYGSIQPIVEPGGYFLVSGTPYSEADIYGSLRKDGSFKSFEYPAIYPDGTILAPDRFSYDYLMKVRRALGTIVFSREYLVVPVSDGSSLFPWSYLERSYVGMENVSLADNINSFPFKLKRVILVCDLAISGAIGADACAFIVMGIDTNDLVYVLDIWHKQGASHNEQVSIMIQKNASFKCNSTVIESNGFQKVIAELAKERGLNNVKEFITDSMKKDLYQGLPALSAAFERGEIRVPYKVGATRDKVLTMFNELNSITINSQKGKLEASAGHDDLAMALWMGYYDLKFGTKKLTIDWI